MDNNPDESGKNEPTVLDRSAGTQEVSKNQPVPWPVVLILLGIILIGAYFRFTGMNWDGDLHLHPDERFMTMVVSSITPVSDLGQFFDTNQSTLNPHNVGYGFYVYGTLPLFIVRYTAEGLNSLNDVLQPLVGRRALAWLGLGGSSQFQFTGYSEIQVVGRYLSGLADLLTVLMVFLISVRLFRHYWLALLAAAFSAGAVLEIQLSHFFTVDTFTNFFTFLAFYFAIVVLTDSNLIPRLASPPKRNSVESEPEQLPMDPEVISEASPTPEPDLVTDAPEKSGVDEAVIPDFPWKVLWTSWYGVAAFVLFGAALGMAIASKVSAAPLAAVIPVVALIRWLQTPRSDRTQVGALLFRNLVIAAVVAFLVFRVCQPYAFSGPGFFGLKPNPKWLDNLSELSRQSGGDVDFPPALQWARRPVTFSLENMVLWGLGLPLGLLAWAGFIWMGWRILSSLFVKRNPEGEILDNNPTHWPAWQQVSVVWIWTLVYFVWQSLGFSRTMRYQLPIYPTLAIMAAWTVLMLWENRGYLPILRRPVAIAIRQTAAILVGVVVLVGTMGWAYAFSTIYTRPTTREAASDWIFQNVPAAINLRVDSGDVYNQPLAFRSGMAISSQKPWILAFQPKVSGTLHTLSLGHVLDAPRSQSTKTLTVSVSETQDGQNPIAVANKVDAFAGVDDSLGNAYTIPFDNPVQVDPTRVYYFRIAPADEGVMLGVSGDVTLTVATPQGLLSQPLPYPVAALHNGEPFTEVFTPVKAGDLQEVTLPMAVDWERAPGAKKLSLVISEQTGSNDQTASAQITADFEPKTDPRGQAYTLQLDKPIHLQLTKPYMLRLTYEGDGALALYGSTQAKESSWDDALPYGIDGYNPFDYTTGLYRDEQNFEMYWDDNADKLNRFNDILNHSDYIFISSNRQWGTTTRVPERYPLTTYFYRNLIGCPQDKDILWCYRVAQPGQFTGDLGFKLVRVFQSEPTLGPLTINTQFAEEAFTVYDHPKVLIFQKTSAYNPVQVSQMLQSVDLTQVVHLIPGQAAKFKSLMLPAVQLAVQQAGGTWSQIFSRMDIFNQFPGLAAVLWYLVITLLGWAVYPFLRLALHGLPDKGYPFARLAGMMILAYLVWLAGSFNLPFSRVTISVVAGLILLANVGLFFLQKEEILNDLRTKRRYLITIEIIALAFFLFFLTVRLGNPDLWHPAKGGEKPMDFSYLNAVIKSTTFPPYDPWFAGGYINYYYYGFVVIGVIIKWLGIIPSIAYNLFLPSFFSMVAIGAFSIIWNLFARDSGPEPGVGGIPGSLPVNNSPARVDRTPLYGGLAGAIGLLVLGNLGTVRMVWQGIMRLNPGVDIDKANIIQKIPWTFQGLVRVVGGASLPYGPGDWYWIPSRVYPGEPITEFPYFTFLYADPHAHMFALPMTIFALAWALSIVKGCWRWGDDRGRLKWLHIGSSFVLAGMVIGALLPTNTWDLPTYLAIGIVVILYTAIRYGGIARFNDLDLPKWVVPAGIGLVASAVLTVLAFGLYRPFATWYGSAYNSIELWKGAHSPFWSYLTHWGLFLFVIFSWFVCETIDWLASTPFSHLKRLQPYQGLITAAGVAVLVALVGLLLTGVEIALIALPMAVWALVLILRPGQPDVKRLVLFMTGTGLTLTLAVELIVLVGDVGRMNTVFKFYVQAWTLLSLSAAAGLFWSLPFIERHWISGWRTGWQVALGLLVFGAALFPVTATTDKVRDRMAPQAPHTLDGMGYMPYSQYGENGHDMQLGDDYQAIRWMQDNVKGSPVIVEANVPEYRWGTRFTIYTGLPGVVGWNWHQRQQRALNSADVVTNRVEQIGSFYNTNSRTDTIDFLQTYGVKYIIVGQLEKAIYDPGGLAKFTEWNGDLWKAVYQQGQTTIYQVLP